MNKKQVSQVPFFKNEIVKTFSYTIFSSSISISNFITNKSIKRELKEKIRFFLVFIWAQSYNSILFRFTLFHTTHH